MDKLDNKGRCCGRKPLIYKRPTHHLFCSRCDRAYDPESHEQIENWAWKKEQQGEFVRVTGGVHSYVR
jgi:hypothetical protein